MELDGFWNRRSIHKVALKAGLLSRSSFALGLGAVSACLDWIACRKQLPERAAKRTEYANDETLRDWSPHPWGGRVHWGL